MTTSNIKARLAAGVIETLLRKSRKTGAAQSFLKRSTVYAAPFALALITTITAQQPHVVDAKVLKTAGTAKDAMRGTWLTYGLTQTEQRYSQLKQIDETNVGKLGLAWSAPLTAAGGRGGTEGTPLMWNDTIYQTMDNSIVYALDARTGQQKWMYDAKIDPITPSHMCCGTHNRGLAIYDGRIILAANDARLISIDALTGKEVWQSKVADINQYYSFTIAPRIAGDKVIVGVAAASISFAASSRRTTSRMDRSRGSSTRFRLLPVSPWRIRIRKRHPRPGSATGRSTAAAPRCGMAWCMTPKPTW